MRLDLPTDIRVLQRYLPRFVALIGRSLWEKRERALIADARGTPFQSHVVQRYHWLELELARLRRARQAAGGLSPRMESVASGAALHFAAAAVEIDAHLDARGRKEWRGRLRDAVKADGGFAPVYLEAFHASSPALSDFDVGFADLGRTGKHDLTFWRAGVRFALECKHISADAGRRIHQRDFYRVMNGMIDALRTDGEIPVTILIKLDDRLPANDAAHRALLSDLIAITREPIGTMRRGIFYELTKRSTLADLGFAPVVDRNDLEQRVNAAYGGACHAITTGTNHAKMTVVMRSLLEDDHSKPQLDAMKAAYRQLPTDRPAFIAIQFDDLDFSELLLPHVNDRMTLITNHFCAERPSEHVAATLFSTYRPHVMLSDRLAWNPIVACWNPAFRPDWRAGLPFQETIAPEVARAVSAAVQSRPASSEEFNRSPSSASWRRRWARRRDAESPS